METLLNDILVFLEDNYVYVVGVGIAIVLILIGFLVSRKKGNKNTKIKESNYNKESMGLETNKSFETNSINPIDIASMNNQVNDFTTNSSFETNSMNDSSYTEPVQETEFKPFGFEEPVEQPKVVEPVQETEFKPFGFEEPVEQPKVVEPVQETEFKPFGFEEPVEQPKVVEPVQETEFKPFGFEEPVEQPVEDLEKTIVLSEPVSTEEKQDLSYIQDKKLDIPYSNPSDLDSEDEIETI